MLPLRRMADVLVEQQVEQAGVSVETVRALVFGPAVLLDDVDGEGVDRGHFAQAVSARQPAVAFTPLLVRVRAQVIPEFGDVIRGKGATGPDHTLEQMDQAIVTKQRAASGKQVRTKR